MTLNLRKNSICEVKNYRQLLVRRLALLETLDGLEVTTEERIRAGEKMSVITQDLVLRCGRLTVRDSDSLASSYEQTTPLLDFFFTPSSTTGTSSSSLAGARGQHEEIALSRAKVSDATWLERLVELDLSRMRLRKIQCMDGLLGLRKLRWQHVGDGVLQHGLDVRWRSAGRNGDVGRAIAAGAHGHRELEQAR